MSDRPKNQNNTAWEVLFERYDILNQINLQGRFVISASQIREYREPRLMAKFDHHINLPQIFSENHLSILPISRGDYVISNFKTYQPFETLNSDITKTSLPDHIQSLDAHSIPSEARAINCAFASGMLSDFLEEDNLLSTVSGRMGSGSFSFDIQNIKTNATSNIEVNNSQIEIDAAFEGVESLSLLEAKIDISEDFLVRQLYYPFRVWRERVSKKVKPIFLVYSNSIFSLYEYEFQDPNSYNSLVLIKHKNYSIEDTNIEISDLQDVMNGAVIQKEPEIPFPQADCFQRVINICELLSTQVLSRENVTERYAFDIRQTNYYTDAARYLGLVEKQYDEQRKPIYYLSIQGKHIMGLPYKQRQLAFCNCILQHQAFFETFKLCMQTGILPERNIIVEIMKRSNLFKVSSNTTFERRAYTVSSWLNWILGLIG